MYDAENIKFQNKIMCGRKKRSGRKEKKQQRDISAIWGTATGKSWDMKFNKVGDLIDIVNFFKFHFNPFSGCGAVYSKLAY